MSKNKLLLTARPDGSIEVRDPEIRLKSTPAQFDSGAGRDLIPWSDVQFHLTRLGIDPVAWKKLPKAAPLKREMNSGHLVTYYDAKAVRMLN